MLQLVPSAPSARKGRYRDHYADPVRRSPNLLTLARVVLAIGFFASLPRCRLDPGTGRFNLAVVIFAVAAFTDFLDGHLARRWGVVSVFGRVMDPR